MENLGNILYIVVIVIYVLYSYLGGGNKNKSTEPLPMPQEKEGGGRTIADMLEDYLEEVAPEENKPRPESVPPAQSQEGGRSGRYKRKLAEKQAQFPRKKHHEAVSMESGKRIETLMPEYDFSSEGGNSIAQAIASSFSENEISDRGIYSSIEGEGDTKEDNKFVFNGRDMVIYDTIMNRKF